MKINGVDDILRGLTKLENAGKLKAARSALLQSANVVKKSAAAKAKAIDDPSTANDISKNVVARFDRQAFRKTGNVKYRVGIAGGAKQNGKGGKGGDTFYWRFLEFGTQHIVARPFLRPAIDENKAVAVDKFASAIKKQIDKVSK
ncbi:HK97-gp10 family putative phage morphogenesis protein [Wohlfahrtiimonas chitiniclastica]|uniref:HK97-gp10 family putative phage morphogenesis protein n=1 Tax=Wohlfahrtiimonas chitiniclastica TaxID=400946 RepID=UPI000B98176F|nr:HK97-gp10 family putative phage morphogenesis protein [Wohlfahrtiimonas chitiniclastica]OYQ76053.1 hypothetical protein B9T18_01480 [Wohlfahrtiimonas chitiniclastica]